MKISYKFKILLLGPPAVGKTSLMVRFIKDTFSENYAMTIGTQILAQDIKLKKKKAKLTIWDIGGQLRFKEIRKSFYTGTNGALLIFDLSRGDTFKEMDTWLTEMREVTGKDIPILLVGNKEDLIQDEGRDVNPHEVSMFASKHNCTYIETSAKTGKKVRKAFKQLALVIAESNILAL